MQDGLRVGENGRDAAPDEIQRAAVRWSCLPSHCVVSRSISNRHVVKCTSLTA